MIELEHSPLGGSGAERWMNCAGSFLLHRSLIEAGEFENIESEYAKLGTAAHEVAAKCLIESREPYEFIGQNFGGYIVGAPDGIDPDALAIYVNECESLSVPGTARLVEETISRPDIHPLLKGTVDFGSYRPGVVLHGRDYKNGEGIGVSAPNNKQMLYYGFLQAVEFELDKRESRDFPVTLGIVQPNFYGVFEAPDVWETTLGVVLDFGRDVLLPRMNHLTSTHDIDDSDFVSGPHCQFCPVMLECPRLKRAFEEYANGEEFIAMLSNQELDRLYAMREDARRFMNALHDTVKARLVGGNADIQSAKLVEKQTRRVWKAGAGAALEAAFGDKAFTARELKSPAQIEKLSSRGKELALEYGYKPEADALTIAPLTDPRPEAKPRTNAKVFGGFGQTNEKLGW